MSNDFDPKEYAKQLGEQLKKNFHEFMKSIPEQQLKELAGERHVTLDEIHEWMGEDNTSISINDLAEKLANLHGETAGQILMETIQTIAPELKEQLDRFQNEANNFTEETKEEPTLFEPNNPPKPKNPHQPEITVDDNEEIIDAVNNKINDEKMEHIQACLENGLSDEETEKTTKVSKEIIGHIRKTR